jgi:hypothetical protein
MVLKEMPSRGGGLNNWLFKAACALYGYRSPEGILAILEEATAGEPIKPEEIERAVTRSALAKEGKLQTGSHKTASWPQINREQREAIVGNGGSLSLLRDASPVQCEIDRPASEEVLKTLFPGDPLICCAPSKNWALTRRVSEWSEFFPRQQFIVPSPMSSTFGKNQDGRRSSRCLDNTGARRFLVVEQDKIGGEVIPLDEQAAILLHLASIWPMALVCHSGGKSLHGWFFCDLQPEARVEHFFRYAVSLGADPATWLRCQLVRLPAGLRDNGSHQTIYFFNPSLIS